MIFQFSPWALAMALSSLVPIGFAVLTWTRRRSPGGRMFFFLMIALSWWQITAAVEMLLVPVSLKILSAQLEYLGVVNVPVLFFLFCFDYGEFSIRLRPAFRALFWLVPGIILILVFTNPSHGLIWPTFTPFQATGRSILIYGHGTALWFYIGYSYALLFCSSLLLLSLITRGQKPVKRQAAWIISGALIPWAGHLVYMLGWGPPGVELTPLAFILAGVFLYKIMFRHRLLNITPVAYGSVFDYMADAVIVFDKNNLVVESNPAAGRLFSLSGERSGEPLEKILEPWPAYRECVAALIPLAGPRSVQCRLDGLWLETRLFNIYDRFREVKGRFLLARDITESKRTEAEKAAALERVQLQQQTLLRLSFSRPSAEGDFPAAVREITEATARAIDVERVSVWLGSAEESLIRCLDLYEKSRNAHSQGSVLMADRYPRYFEALAQDRMIDASDAAADPRTREFADGYLRPLGIGAMLDAPIRVSGSVVGIVCCEHIGGPRAWLDDEVRFAGEIADAAGHAFANWEKRKIDDARRESEERFRLLVEAAPDGIFVQAEGHFVYINEAAVRLFGAKSADEILGRPVLDRIHPDFRDHAREQLALINKGPKSGPLMEAAFLRLDGTSLETETSAVPFTYRGLDGALVFVRDSTKRKQAENALRVSLDEKSVLLREIQNRVRNNMQLVSSLLNHQAGAFSDPSLRGAFLASRDRIKAIALIHEKMHRAGDLARIDFADYLQSLVIHLFHLYRVDLNRIRYDLHLDPASLDLNVSIPLGLIANELIINSLQHAFPGDNAGKIFIRLSKSGEHFQTMEIRDDGIGIPGKIDLKNAKTLGFQLIGTLVEQIDGVAKLETRPGTAFTITFPDQLKLNLPD